jgi:2-oxoisovalerate dehydrogenase E1 component
MASEWIADNLDWPLAPSTILSGWMHPPAALEISEKELFTRNFSGKPVLDPAPRPIFSFGLLIRETEQALLRLFSEGLLSGTTHTCLGQELCQMSVVRALNDANDIILSNHRNHGHFLAYSGDFFGLVAEIMGREGGVCAGIGGSQHLAFRGFHSNGVQGGMTAIGAGHGLAMRMGGGSGIVAVIVGDGTLGQGLLYESLNLASVWELPMLFVVENNRIAQTTPTSATTGGSIAGRASAFGIENWRLDDAAPDFLESVESVVAAVRARRRPGFLIVDTMRMGPHSKGDDLRGSAEMAAIRERDPLECMGRRLPQPERDELRRAARDFVDSVCARAMAAPPAQRLLASDSIFVLPPQACSEAPPVPAAGSNVRANLNAALRTMLKTSPKVILLGEDLHDPYGGAFKVTSGLSTEFPERVISTPISEAGVVGAGIGLALHGYLPVVEIMFADFITLAFDQISNHAVKFPGMFPEARTPLVIRTPAGGRRGYGPTHSQNPETLLCAVPGLTVVFPSARHVPGDLLWSSVFRWPYPAVFLEHKLLYGAAVDPAGYRVCEPALEDAGATLFPTLAAGDADPDLTLIAYGGMVELAEAAAAELRLEELAVEIVVPSLLSPFPRHTLTRLLAGRERIVTLEETHHGCGFSAELGAALLEAGFRGRFARVATPPVPIPAARSLESLIMPDRRRIAQAVLRVLDA